MLFVQGWILASQCHENSLSGYLFASITVLVLVVLYEIVGSFLQAWLYGLSFFENVLESMTVRHSEHHASLSTMLFFPPSSVLLSPSLSLSLSLSVSLFLSLSS